MRRVLVVAIAVLLCTACTGQARTQLTRAPDPILGDPGRPISITYSGALRSDPAPTPTPAVAVSQERALATVRAGTAPHGLPRMALRLVTITNNPPTNAAPRLMWVLVWPEESHLHGTANMTQAEAAEVTAEAAKARCVGVDAVDAATARVHGYWVTCA